MPIIVQTTLLLIASNVFMTIAWYAHLKDLASKPWYIAAFISWLIAFLEYRLLCVSQQRYLIRQKHKQFDRR